MTIKKTKNLTVKDLENFIKGFSEEDKKMEVVAEYFGDYFNLVQFRLHLTSGKKYLVLGNDRKEDKKVL